MNQFEEIYKQLAKDFDLHSSVIEAIVRSEFEFVTEVMEAGDLDNPETFTSIRIQYFGQWEKQPKLIQKVIDKRKK